MRRCCSLRRPMPPPHTCKKEQLPSTPHRLLHRPCRRSPHYGRAPHLACGHGLLSSRASSPLGAPWVLASSALGGDDLGPTATEDGMLCFLPHLTPCVHSAAHGPATNRTPSIKSCWPLVARPVRRQKVGAWRSAIAPALLQKKNPSVF